MELGSMNNKWAGIILGILFLSMICASGEALRYGTPESIYVDTITLTDLMVYGNLSHVKTVFKDPINQSGGIFTVGDLTVLDVLRQSNKTPVNIGDTIPVYVMGGTIGNITAGREEGIMLQEGEGPFLAGIYCLGFDKDGIDLKNKYFISDRLYRSYEIVKQDITNLSSGNVTSTQILDREKKKRETI